MLSVDFLGASGDFLRYLEPQTSKLAFESATKTFI